MAALDKDKIPSEEEKIQFLKKTIRILEDNNIDYWLESGTLLGCIRDGKFIEWDSDIDLGVWDIDTIKKLEPAFNKENLFLSIIWENSDVHTPVLRVTTPNMNYFHISLTKFEKIDGCFCYKFLIRTKIVNIIRNAIISLFGENNCKLLKTISENNKKTAGISKKFVFRLFIINILKKIGYFLSRKNIYIYKPFKTIKTKFYDINVRIPEDYKKHLLYAYGETWQIPDKNFNDYAKYAKKVKGIYITKFWEEE